VLDFGLAKLLYDDGSAPHTTRAGVVMGTPYYMAPEQCEGGREVDERADVYALGVVLFEMLTGKLPFGGGSHGEVLLKQMTMRAPAARSIVPTLPEEIDAVLHRALAKDPERRFPTMAAFKEALLAPADQPPRDSVDEDLTGRMRLARPMSRAEIRRRRRRGRGAKRVALTALACLALSASATLWWIDRQTRAAAPAAVAAPSTVALSFSSDPDGATVLDPGGAVLGTTPLSIRVERTEVPVAYVFQKEGFTAKTMSLIPNVPSSVFAAMQPEAQAVAAPPPAPAEPERAAPSTREHHGRVIRRMRDDTDLDGVLAPSFLK
jgi:hypothetical protein